MSFASLVEPVPHESRSEEESSEERSDRSRLSRLMRSAPKMENILALVAPDALCEGAGVVVDSSSQVRTGAPRRKARRFACCLLLPIRGGGVPPLGETQSADQPSETRVHFTPPPLRMRTPQG